MIRSLVDYSLLTDIANAACMKRPFNIYINILGLHYLLDSNNRLTYSESLSENKIVIKL